MEPSRATGAFVEGPMVEIAPTGKGALDGLRFAVKDLIDVAGTVTGGGNPDWRRAQKPAIRSAPVVNALLAAGARLHGKTITDELAFSLEGANHHEGTPLNTRAPDRLPGGSSSGSASAVAAGLVDFALGTDTGGSVRVPAAFCGLYGFRPSHGAVSLDGVVPFAPSYDTVGWFARNLSTLARVTATLVPDGRENGIVPRLLLAEDVFDLADRIVSDALKKVLSQVVQDAQSMRLFAGSASDWLESYRVLQGAEIWDNLGAWIISAKPEFGPAMAPRFADAATITAEEVARWATWRRTMSERLTTLLGGDGLLILPTAPCIAPLKSASGDEIGAFYQRALPMTSIAGHAGLPQLTLPLTDCNGCPVGLSLVGPRGRDRWLIARAGTLFGGLLP